MAAKVEKDTAHRIKIQLESFTNTCIPLISFLERDRKRKKKNGKNVRVGSLPNFPIWLHEITCFGVVFVITFIFKLLIVWLSGRLLTSRKRTGSSHRRMKNIVWSKVDVTIKSGRILLFFEKNYSGDQETLHGRCKRRRKHLESIFFSSTMSRQPWRAGPAPSK